MNPVHYSALIQDEKTPALERGALDRGKLPPQRAVEGKIRGDFAPVGF